MSLPSNSNVLSNITQKRDASSGLNLSNIQSAKVPKGLRSEVLIIPSVSAPTFGSVFVVDIKEKNIQLNDLVLALNVSQITGLSGGTGLRWVPGHFFFTRVEVVQNIVIVDTLYGLQQHVSNQLFFFDEDRIFRNNLAGNYASVAQRTTLASAANTIYVNLKTYFDQCNIPLLTENHSVQLRCYVDNLTNLYATTTAYTGTAVATISSASVICKVLRLDPNTAQSRLNAMVKKPEHNLYHSVRYGQFSINSGVSSSTIVLTPVVGSVAFMFFTVRNTNALTGDGAFKFNAIQSFNLLGSDGSSIVGGQPIPSQIAIQYLQQYYSRSSYTTETSIGSLLTGATNDNGANLYAWSFSHDPVNAITNGQALGSRKMIGAEQLQLYFPSALGSAVQVDVYAFCEGIIEQGVNFIKTYQM